ncbi:MAG: glycosyltransferase family 2 protein [Candidatus Omnitrophica bacterium]|nr:glycosyltransferase family 2 protein [Candidatus Omnitrophota bacterium]
MNNMRLSIVIPVFNEQGSLNALHKKLSSVLEKMDMSYEVIFIDDASTDQSSAILNEIKKQDGKVKIITLIRNYGQTQAISAGVDEALGEIIVTMDADLQNDPADIPRILAKLDEGYDVVSGWRKKRKDGLWLRKIPSNMANLISVWITGVKIHDLGCALKAYRYRVLKNIEFHGEIHRLLPLYAAIQGAKITEISVKHQKRKYGKSKYGISRLFKVILDLFAVMFMWKFLPKPIYAFGGIGLASVSFSGAIGLFIIFRKIFLAGVWVSPLLFIFVIFFLIGIQFMLMGIIAEFILRLYCGVKDIKRYKVKHKE